MTFLRTDAGLSNQSLFLDVDFVVYIEGAEPLDNKAVPPDALFWKAAFDIYAPTTKVTLKGLGGKPALLDVAEKVRDGRVSNCLVCMDADYDRQNSETIGHPNILYTYGYSWENDVVSKGALLDALTVISTVDADDPNLSRDIDAAFKNAERIGKLIGPVDIRAQKEGVPIQNKKKPGELLLFKRACVPEFNPKQVCAKVRIAREKCSKLPIQRNQGFDFYRDYSGKALLLISYHVVGYLSQLYGNVGGMSLNVFQNILLRAFSRELRANTNHLSDHYRQQLITIS